MKYVFVALLAIFFVSCSSGTKKSQDLKTENSTQKVYQKEKTEAKTDAKKVAPAGEINSIVKCETGGDKREIAIVVNESGRCEVLYTKNKETNVKGNGNPNGDFCTNLAGKIRSNLESAGFTCK